MSADAYFIFILAAAVLLVLVVLGLFGGKATDDDAVPNADDIRDAFERTEAEKAVSDIDRRSRTADRRANDPALPHVGEGFDRRQRTRRQRPGAEDRP